MSIAKNDRKELPGPFFQDSHPFSPSQWQTEKKGTYCLQAQVTTNKHFPGGDAYLINLSSSNVIFPRQSDIQETLIIP